MMATPRLQLTFTERAELATSSVATRLFEIMSTKETNLCLALDETDASRFLTLAEAIGPEIAVLKTHIDTVENFSGMITVELNNLAREHNFLIFEDRKFADIGQTVKNQYTKGAFHIIEWADIVNAHALPGPGIVDGLREEVAEYNMLDKRGLLLLAQMSSKDNLITTDYTAQVVEMAKRYPDFVMGFIGAGAAHLPKLAAQTPPEFLILAPGVKLQGEGDTLGQQYNTPESVVAAGADVIIVGRDIYQSAKPLAKAKQYREAGWNAFQERLGLSKVLRDTA